MVYSLSVSGGPLFDGSGSVVGINSQIYSRSGGFQGVSFAIPINVALKLKDQIVATGKAQHALLGVTVQDLNQQLADSLGLKRVAGPRVPNATPVGAAAAGGAASPTMPPGLRTQRERPDRARSPHRGTVGCLKDAPTRSLRTGGLAREHGGQ